MACVVLVLFPCSTESSQKAMDYECRYVVARIGRWPGGYQARLEVPGPLSALLTLSKSSATLTAPNVTYTLVMPTYTGSLHLFPELQPVLPASSVTPPSVSSSHLRMTVLSECQVFPHSSHQHTRPIYLQIRSTSDHFSAPLCTLFSPGQTSRTLPMMFSGLLTATCAPYLLFSAQQPEGPFNL